MDVNILKLQPKDLEVFKQVIFLFEDVFEMKDFRIPADAYLLKLLHRDDFAVFAALNDDEVVGGMTSYTLHQYYSTSTFVYIYDLAVKTKFQRRGIGRQLIYKIKQYFTLLEVEEIFVQADLEDDYALDFYRSTGGIAEDVVHFSYPLNPTIKR